MSIYLYERIESILYLYLLKNNTYTLPSLHDQKNSETGMTMMFDLKPIRSPYLLTANHSYPQKKLFVVHASQSQ